MSTQQQQQHSNSRHPPITFLLKKKQKFFVRKFMLSFVPLKLCEEKGRIFFSTTTQQQNCCCFYYASFQIQIFCCCCLCCVVYIMAFITRRKMVGSISINTWICQKDDLRTKRLKFFGRLEKTNDFCQFFFLLDHTNKLAKVFVQIKCFFLSLFCLVISASIVKIFFLST